MFGLRTFFTITFAMTLVLGSNANASPYFELGTSLSSFKNGDTFFGQPNATSSGFGFTGSFSFYIPVTSLREFAHLDLGLQNRLSTFSNQNGDPFAVASPNLAVRLEFWRFYAGAGYAPLTFASKSGSGIGSLHSNPDTKSYFLEGGMIWRVIPEFQITANYSLEFASSAAGQQMTGMEYGLRFRFPLFPKEFSQQGGGVDFDGFRYPFGFMQ
jgi:hypothetical protein